jgi:hypothetical protein
MQKKPDLRPQWLKDMHGKRCECMACHDHKPDPHRPIRQDNPDGSHYYCPDCWKTFWTYKACNLHMGRVPNIMGNCPGRIADAKH